MSTSDAQDHYFTAEPASAAERRRLDVELAGRTVTVHTAPGVFCPDRLDIGTAVLLREVPAPPASGNLLDLGCGWGPVALTLGLRSPGAAVWAVDVNRRALALAADNARAVGVEDFHACTPEEVPEDLRFATIWSNPPIRVGKAALHDLLSAWLGRLGPAGEAYLVVQKHLGSDSLHRWLVEEGWPTERVASRRSFRVLRCRRSEP